MQVDGTLVVEVLVLGGHKLLLQHISSENTSLGYSETNLEVGEEVVQVEVGMQDT